MPAKPTSIIAHVDGSGASPGKGDGVTPFHEPVGPPSWFSKE